MVCRRRWSEEYELERSVEGWEGAGEGCCGGQDGLVLGGKGEGVWQCPERGALLCSLPAAPDMAG